MVEKTEEVTCIVCGCDMIQKGEEAIHPENKACPLYNLQKDVQEKENLIVTLSIRIENLERHLKEEKEKSWWELTKEKWSDLLSTSILH